MTMSDDVRHAWRAWIASLRTGGSTILVIVTLALGIGATTAMFALVNGLLNVLPYPHAQQLVMLWEARKPGPATLHLSIPDYEDFAARSRSFASLGLFAPRYHNLMVDGGVERIMAPEVGTGFFDGLGVQMAMGRDARADDVQVVLLSEQLWRSRFPGWADPIGKSVRVDGVDRRIVGIVPKGQGFPATAQMWLPFVPTAQACGCGRNGHSYRAIGRLKEGVSLAQASAEIDGIARQLALVYADTNANISAWLKPARDEMIGNVRPAMLILLAATVSMLLLACVSVASILLARGGHRRAEIAMRQALGATRGRIVVQFLFEGAFSAVAASTLGILVASWALPLFSRMVPASLPQVRAVSLGPAAVGFAVAVALLTVLIFSWLPALHVTRASLVSGIRGEELARALRRSPGPRSALIVIENTVAFALLVTSILLLNSLFRLANVDPGFGLPGVVSVDLTLTADRYSTPPQAISFYTTLLERVRGLAGVEAAAVVDYLPMTGSTEGMPYFAVDKGEQPARQDPIARTTVVSPGYFETMSIPLRRGRDFSAADGKQSHVMVISEGIARANWPNADPIGKRIGVRGFGSWEVIGVVPDIKDDGLTAAAPARIYLNQQEFGKKEMTVVARGNADPVAMARSVRQEVNRLDPSLPVNNVTTVEEVVKGSFARNRTMAQIVGAFAVMALILAAVGVYGVMLSNLVQRTREFGIRIAVGSGFGHIVWLVLREGLLLVSIGLVAGLVLAFGSSRIVTGLLFGVEALDLPSYLTGALVLLVAASSGCLVLLRRINRLDPVAILRC